MNEIVTEKSEGVLRIVLNRPAKRNAMTSSMYVTLADVFADAAKDESTRVALWHGAGDSFCAGNDIEDFLKNPPGPGVPPQARLMQALIAFDKPLVAAVHGAAIGGGTTMLTHCDLVYAGESARFKTPFVDLALVPEFGSSYSIPARAGHARAAEIILLGLPFNATRAMELGVVTRVTKDDELLTTATDVSKKLAAKSRVALQTTKRLMKQPFLPQLRAAIAAENIAFSEQVHSADAKEAFAAFLEKRPPKFGQPAKSGADR